MRNKIKRALEDYEDILEMPRHVSSERPQMPRANRSAQFAPFAAVVGHGEAVKEAARYTDKKKELDEMEKAIIDNQIRDIEAELSMGYDVQVDYFVQDPLKAGGCYTTKIGPIKKFDLYLSEIVFIDGMKIPIEDVYSIEKRNIEKRSI